MQPISPITALSAGFISLLAITTTGVLPVLGSPVPALDQNAATLDARQTPIILTGTCTVSTNLCLVNYTIGYPGATANYTCGRYISIGYSATDPNKRCFEDGHACTTTIYGLTAANTVCN